MSLYHNSKQKIRHLQRTIDGLLEGDFPLAAGQKALEKLRGIFSDLDSKLDRARRLKDAEAEKSYSQLVNLKVHQTLPILGFILRSTNVRNAFEILDPLQEIATSILQGRPQLLLSSEWDYVPFAYPQNLDDLRSFILIGMPASEAASALLIPLAGHELGHAVWRNRGLGGGVHAKLQERCVELYDRDKDRSFRRVFPNYSPTDMIYKELYTEAIALSVKYAVFQAEELFCDMFAYAFFGESYLHAFAYIIAPGSGRVAGSKYPSHKTRMTTLSGIAAKEGVALPTLASLSLADELTRPDPQERYLVGMAETSVGEIVNSLWDTVQDLLKQNGVCRPSSDMCESHLREFRMGVPAHSPKCLGDIINAGWRYYVEQQSDKSEKGRNASQATSDKIDAVNEMMLKTIEVLEFNRRTVL